MSRATINWDSVLSGRASSPPQRGRQAPLIVCPVHGTRFRSWRASALCPDCRRERVEQNLDPFELGPPAPLNERAMRSLRWWVELDDKQRLALFENYASRRARCPFLVDAPAPARGKAA